MKKYDLVVIISVFNEEFTVIPVLNQWISVLSMLNIKYKLIIFDDGSTDNTVVNINEVNSENVELIKCEHMGYSKTINYAYKYVNNTNWLFNADFDDEIMPSEFIKLWNNRLEYDAVFGCRGKRKNYLRRISSLFAKYVVSLLFTKNVLDVNIPFRLLKFDLYKNLLKNIPEKTLYPNLLISAYTNYYKIKCCNIDIEYKCRSFGKSHLNNILKLFKHCIVSTYQLIKFRFNVKK